jgi:hypothetical protein
MPWNPSTASRGNFQFAAIMARLVAEGGGVEEREMEERREGMCVRGRVR